MPNNNLFIVTIGASAGGLNAASEICSQLPKDINAAIFIVLHLSKTAMSEILLTRIQKNAALPCKIAEDNEPIKKSQVYIAAPDTHMLVKEEKIVIGHGPAENRFRPSIDVLFRSAAASHREKTIGIILTGLLNDGTIGMHAIKHSGGYCIVQDPNEAEYPDMPLAVLETLEVDEVAPLRRMGEVILDRINTKNLKSASTPENIIAESKLSEKAATSIEGISKIGEASFFTCPDCGGRLWKVENGKLKHYRCHTGHVYSEDDLAVRQAETIEQTIWVALRMLEERKLLLQKFSKQQDKKGLEHLSNHYLEQSNLLENHITKLKELLHAIHKEG